VALPEHSIYTLHRPGRLLDLLEREQITELSEVLRASMQVQKELKARHYIQIEAIESQTVHVDASNLIKFLDSFSPPYGFLDFESTSLALPSLPGLGPWEHVPFLASVHILPKEISWKDLKEQDSVENLVQGESFYLGPSLEQKAGLKSLAEFLLSKLKPVEVIFAYGSPFEIAAIKRLARLVPEYEAELLNLIKKIADLQQPFAEFWFYHPQQKGKISLKTILPLLSSKNHGGLKLKSGAEAHVLYALWKARLQESGSLPETFADPEMDLKAYCSMDTLGLLYILKAFSQYLLP